MKVFVTGATGFTGSRLVPLLLQHGYSVRCLHRPTSDRSPLPQPTIEWVTGDVSHTDAFSAALRGTDVLVNVVSLGFGHADSIVRAARDAGVRRVIFLSTTAIFTRLNASSKSLRMDAERSIETSGLEYTILRPTMIYGSPRDRNMWRLIRFLRYSPMIPIFGNGESLQQPIFVDDVARAILSCLQADATIRKSYNIAGKHPLTYNQVIDTVAALLKKRIWKLHIPYRPVVIVLKLLERMHLPLPIRSEQVLRLNEAKSFSYEDAARDFEFHPLSFDEGLALELNSPR